MGPGVEQTLDEVGLLMIAAHNGFAGQGERMAKELTSCSGQAAQILDDGEGLHDAQCADVSVSRS